MIYLVHLSDLQAPITDADLVSDGEVLRLDMNEKRGTGGGVATLELEIRNPGYVILRQTGYVAVVDAPTGTLADPRARILARARIARIPDDLGGLTIRLRLECAPASWRGLLKAAANNVVQGAGILPYVVPTIPNPGVGVIGLALAPNPATRWDSVKADAIVVRSFFQDDITRNPLSSNLRYTTLSIANALAVLTVTDSPALRAAAGRGLSAIIAVSGDKDPSHGVPVAVGQVIGVRPAPFGTLDVLVNLASGNLVAAGIASAVVGDRSAVGLPFYDPLFPGQREDLTNAVLEGRSAVWHVDPVTHAISLDDVIQGQRTIDLGDLGDAASQRSASVDTPVRHVKLRLVAEFTQYATGTCDIAPVVSGGFDGGSLSSLSMNGIQAAQLGGDVNTGWSSSAPNIATTRTTSAEFYTGRSFIVTYRDDTMYWSYFTDTNGQQYARQEWLPGPEYDMQHDEKAKFVVYHYTYGYWPWRYTYSQTRREVVDLTLDIDVQPYALSEDLLDLGTIQLNDVNALEGVQPWQDGIAYNKGDRVLRYGRLYECLADRVVVFYAPVTTVRNGQPSTRFATPYWKDLGAGTPMGDPRNASYFRTTRGRRSIEAALLRMRAAALRRLGALRFGKVFPWEAARDVTLRDRVRFLVRDGEAVMPVVGKVEEIRRVVEGGGTAYVELSITACLGTGANAAAAPAPEAYVVTGYVSPTYAPAPGQAFKQSDVPGYITTGTSATGDMEWALSGDTLKVPIDAFQLGNPAYSVLSAKVERAADEQIGFARSLIARQLSPMSVARDYPTTLTPVLRSLRNEGNIENFMSARARMTVSPRGVDMVTGGEP